MTKQKILKKIEWLRTLKQEEAWDYLNDETTTELLFGGGAGGAKSFLGCAWIISNCGRFKGSRWMIGRSKLKTLKQTTLRTFFEVCAMWRIKAGKDFKYNAQEGIITFSNGSEVFLKDLFLFPADPEFNSLGSFEVTGAFIDEANQITAKARDVVNSRIRFKLDCYCHICGNTKKTKILELDEVGKPKKWICGGEAQHKTKGLIPKTLYTCNPDKNFVYSEFYKPWRDGTLPEFRRFVQALAIDNPFLPNSYITQLKRIRDNSTKERLLYGNWEFDDDPARLFDFTVVHDAYTLVINEDENKRCDLFCSVDVGRSKNGDPTIIRIWKGLQSVKTIRLQGSKTDEVVIKLKQVERGWGIRRSHFVVDEDGIGGGVVDNFKGCIGFLNGSRQYEERFEVNQFEKRNYKNLKTQCYFMLSQYLEQGDIGITCDEEEKELLTEELQQIKRLNMYDDTKSLEVTHKEEIRERIGRSPDYADTLMMRMIFELKKPQNLDSLGETVYNKSETVGGNLMKTKF